MLRVVSLALLLVVTGCKKDPEVAASPAPTSPTTAARPEPLAPPATPPTCPASATPEAGRTYPPMLALVLDPHFEMLASSPRELEVFRVALERKVAGVEQAELIELPEVKRAQARAGDAPCGETSAWAAELRGRYPRVLTAVVSKECPSATDCQLVVVVQDHGAGSSRKYGAPYRAAAREFSVMLKAVPGLRPID